MDATKIHAILTMDKTPVDMLLRKIPKELHTSFKMQAAKEGKNMRQLLLQLMEEHCKKVR